MLQRFIHSSQFIIITHNKRTIGIADVLYGVTMQEHGISKIVSVKFHKTTEAATQTATLSLETPVTGTSVEKEADESHKRDETIEVTKTE